MADPFLGQVSTFGFNFAPRSWAFCNGQILPINQNQSLYSLLGTMYGGDGRTTFGLPDLRGRVTLGFGTGYTEGAKSGTETVQLTTQQMPSHSHAVNAKAATATGDLGTDNFLAQPAVDVYRTTLDNPAAMGPDSVANAGGGQPHNNMQPFLAINFCIALRGTFPSRN